MPGKTAAGWTGANERTAKNGFRALRSERRASCSLPEIRRVLNALLAMAGRPDLIAAAKLAGLEQAILDLLSAVRNLNGSSK
jgi:hypothetical protein